LSAVVGCPRLLVVGLVVRCLMFVVSRSFVVCWLLLVHVGRLLSVVGYSCPPSVVVCCRHCKLIAVGCWVSCPQSIVVVVG
jgi:hypothetical protein